MIWFMVVCTLMLTCATDFTFCVVSIVILCIVTLWCSWYVLVWLCYTPMLFFLMSKGGESYLFLYCRTHNAAMLQDIFWPSSKRGILLKGRATSTHMKMVLMMSKATLHVHYQFRISPILVRLCIRLLVWNYHM